MELTWRPAVGSRRGHRPTPIKDANHVPYEFYATRDCGRTNAAYVDNLRTQNIQQMKYVQGINPDINFIIVGFSGGAGFTTSVGSEAIKQKIPASSMQIIELDSAINQSGNRQGEISSLGQQGVLISVFHSIEYQINKNRFDNPPGICKWTGYLCGFDLPEESLPSGVLTHRHLAVDERFFNQRILPLLPGVTP